MTLLAMMTWLEHRPFAISIAESTWLFPIIETVHVLALTIVVGSVAMMDLRLLGVGRNDRAASEVIASTLPWAWSSFVVAVTAGSLLFSSKAATYYVNLPFRIKVACLALAGVNMLIFHLVTARGMAAWDRGTPPPAARRAAALSLTLWIVIVATGRWIGFT
ncbi:MAG: hypothetical protein JWM63_2000 [Gammaproteobacteria bacterium]|jgi:hypothetical protein|nr:hypothetical protein [Gammaproteobacteria bacterium]